MAATTLTFGVELEFICLRSDDCELLKSSMMGDSIGPALHKCLLDNGVAATGYEDLDQDINDSAPSHSRWRVESEELDLSRQERAFLPQGWDAESIEMSSRKFYFHTDDWRSEVMTVLKVLRILETQYGCRFITNQSTGMHVHVGNDTQRVPVRTAKNVWQLATAFEGCFDELHTVPRITIPKQFEWSHCYYPPSFFWTQGQYKLDRVVDGPVNVLDRLADIEMLRTHEHLGGCFGVLHPDAHVNCQLTGHNSAYNFDNLFPMEEYDRFEETLTGTIEFRQHTGSLDYMTIVAWVNLTCRLVQFATTAPDSEFVGLCVRAADISFRLRDLLVAVDCPADVITHYLSQDPEIVLMIAEQLGPMVHTHPQVEILIEQNDYECEERADRAAVEAAIDQKYAGGLYGIDPAMHDFRSSSDAAAAKLATILEIEYEGPELSPEETVLQTMYARAQVIRSFAEAYREGVLAHARKSKMRLSAILEEE